MKVKILIKRTKWNAHLIDKNYKGHQNQENYIFKSRKWQPHHKEIADFESDLLELFKNKNPGKYLTSSIIR